MQTLADIANNLFSVTTNTQSQLDNISNSALSRGVDAFTNKNYDAAITEFKRAIGLSPYGSNTMQAFQLLANAYKQQGKTDEAIKAWQQAAKLFPQSDIPHSGLGDIYYSQGNYLSAEKEYTMAVRLNPTIASNVYSLGQAFLAEGRYTDAAAQFKKAILYSPTDPSSYYSLGQAYHKMGQYDDAVTQLKKAISVNKTFTDSYLELGMTYTDMKQTDKAKEMVNQLNSLNQSSQAAELQNYMSQVAAPKFIAAYSLNAFNFSLGAGSSVSALNSSLTDPGSSMTFTMNFAFSKEMDPTSVQNTYNWLISRSTGTEMGGAYNWGLAVQPTETNVSPIPISVIYHEDTFTADVIFRVSQNDAGNATIDPSHLMFKFSGLDSYGNSMDQSADQFSGISKIV